MAYRVEISPTAFADVENLYLWIVDRAPEQATPWFEGCYEAMLSLENFPERCPRAPESQYIGIEIRQLLYGKQRKYRILFTIDSDKRTGEEVVHIHRVRRAAQERLRTQEELMG